MTPNPCGSLFCPPGSNMAPITIQYTIILAQCNGIVSFFFFFFFFKSVSLPTNIYHLDCLVLVNTVYIPVLWHKLDPEAFSRSDSMWVLSVSYRKPLGDRWGRKRGAFFWASLIMSPTQIYTPTANKQIGQRMLRLQKRLTYCVNR